MLVHAKALYRDLADRDKTRDGSRRGRRGNVPEGKKPVEVQRAVHRR